MTRLTLIAPLILAACAPALDCERRLIPTLGTPVCERQMEREGERNTPAGEAPHHGGEHHDPEPDRELDEAAHDAWQERNGL